MEFPDRYREMGLPKQSRIGLRVSVLSALFVLWSGCAHTTGGISLNSDKTAFIHDGVTLRAEVLENLGQPLYEFEAAKTIGYTWETVSPDVTSSIIVSTVLGESQQVDKDPERWFLFISFDKHNRVSRHGRIHQPGTESSEEALTKWLKMKSG